ncbi:MAG TPA: IS66 family insertion sequence element accessory protein TnpB [Steroidobacteraceae bacterium]|nr:IS66 family insertion sequence element accessory protein TnpB [Steroidobacteraceae bacterium]
MSLPPSVKIYLALGGTDMRKQIDSLAALVEHVLEEDPFSGHLFGFCNRARNRAKFLYWEESGYWLLHKRLEKGRFAWPDGETAAMKLDATELHALLGGLDFRHAHRRRWYRREIPSCGEPSR